MTINSSVETENIEELNGHTLILKIRQTILRVEPQKKEQL